MQWHDPSITIVFDNGTFSGIDGTDIKEAMFGKETVTFSKLGQEIVAVSGIHADRSGRLSPTSNTTISAVAHLCGSGDLATLTLYHNHFAANPISPDWFRHRQFLHCALSDEFYGWTEI